ncbi:MAG: penicillin acylase family protein [Polyangiaceae bacterium]|nr:penicillin acylase family protein [Polyangiaceae bacterium]
MQLRRLFRFGWMAAAAAIAASACGDDEPAKQRAATGGAAGASGASGASGAAGSSGASGAAGADAGPDLGPFGDQVPVTTETTEVTGLLGPVNVVRDRHGMVHIYARHLEDAFRLQGYMMALDRAPQLEIMRRVATGRLAEVVGAIDPGQIDDDITMRHVGLHRAAEAMYAALPAGSEAKRGLDAFADGISQYFAKLNDGSKQLAVPFAGATGQLEAFTPQQALAIARLQTFALSYDAGDGVSLSSRMQALRDAFPSGSADPAIAARAGMVRDVIRFAPADPAVHQAGFPNDAPLPRLVGAGTVHAKLGGPTQHHAPIAAQHAPVVRAATLRALERGLRSIQRLKDVVGGDEFAGSNNWAVAATHSESGNAMVASDPHLGLSGPMVFWANHLTVRNPAAPAEDFEIAGLAFAGIPGVILGANRHLAWGATTASFDVTDDWRETISADGQGVVFGGQDVPFQKIQETVKVNGKPDLPIEILVVPHHGPLLPVIDSNHQLVAPAAGGEAVSVRWTGHAPTRELEAVTALWRATTVDEARAALSLFGTGAQNWTLADANGDVFTYSPGHLPFRDERALTWNPATYDGLTPNMLLDGASGHHEWTGEFLDERYIPKVRTPASGWVATANGDHIGTTLDNDPTNEVLPAPDGRRFYLQGDYDLGFRIGRVQALLTAATASGGKVSAAEMAEMQGDVQSPLGLRLAPLLVEALERAEAERATPSTHPDLAAVVADARYDAAAVAQAITLLDAWVQAGAPAASGVDPTSGALLTGTVLDHARATSLFNGWMVRVLARTFDDELSLAGTGLGSQPAAKAFLHLALSTPSSLATYDAVRGDSALWDDLGTAGILETRHERMVVAFLDALESLASAFGSADRATWAWGKLHRVTFSELVPLWPSQIPPDNDPVAPNGFFRHGDMFVVDASNYGLVRGLGSPLSFTYGSGPVQRFVAEVSLNGPIVRNALPGGAQIWPSSPFFRDEADLWSRNESHDVPFNDGEVVAAAVSPGGEHVLFR